MHDPKNIIKINQDSKMGIFSSAGSLEKGKTQASHSVSSFYTKFISYRKYSGFRRKMVIDR